jgi:hypothetical protein
VGQSCYAIGNPYGFGQTLTTGVSAFLLQSSIRFFQRFKACQAMNPKFFEASGVCPCFVRSLALVCPWFVRSLPGLSLLCPKFIRDLCQICPKSIPGLSLLCPKFIHDLFQICPKFVSDLSLVCPKLIPFLSLLCLKLVPGKHSKFVPESDRPSGNGSTSARLAALRIALYSFHSRFLTSCPLLSFLARASHSSKILICPDRMQVVSGLDRMIPSPSGKPIPGAIQTDAAINSGQVQ